MMMKNVMVALVAFLCWPLIGQDLNGGWSSIVTPEDGTSQLRRMIISDGFIAITAFERETGAFEYTYGGAYTYEEDTLYLHMEFDSRSKLQVGTIKQMPVHVEKDKLIFTDTGMIWKRMDNATEGDLAGAWLMSGRMRDDQLQHRDTNRPRKTMKILSGTLFQWIAYNTETKEFMATGGGRYTTIAGKYTEMIDFFSRDTTRVGAELVFDYALNDGHWHHSVFSSKGNPLYEIWSPRQLEKQ